MSAKMIAEEGSLAGLVISLDEGDTWTLGRGPQATVLISDPEAGQLHLRLSTIDAGIQVEPLENNSVQVNDEEVHGTQLLHHGDVLKIGGSRFRFYREIGETDLEKEGSSLPTTPSLKPILHTEPLKDPKTDDPKIKDEETKENQAYSELHDEIIAPPEENMPAQTLSNDSLTSDSLNNAIADPAQDEAASTDLLNTTPSLDSSLDAETPPEDLLSHIDFGIDESGPFLLKVIRGPNNGAEFSMEPGRAYTLGTDPQVCDVVFHDMSISRQHARITITPDNLLFIEDLGSRNGTSIDENKVTEKIQLGEHIVVSLGTTSFIVFNRDGERNTIITPFLPSIVRSLQSETEKQQTVELLPPKEVLPLASPTPQLQLPHHPSMSPTKKRFLIGLASLLLLLFVIGASTLFQTTALTEPQYNTGKEIEKILKPYPDLQYSYNKESKRLFLIGHILNVGDQTQLMYTLQSLPFVRVLDTDNLIIDEGVLKEINQILNKNPQWSGVSMRTSTPGHFVISGYLKKRQEFDALRDFLSQDFRYLDRLENRIVVEEEQVSAIRQILDQANMRGLTLKMDAGVVTLEGGLPPEQFPELDKVIEQIKKQTSVHAVRNAVTPSRLTPLQAFIDLTSTYRVTGSASVSGKNVSVFINGRILSRGDILDGMTITDIQRNVILLEKDGVQYRIDYNK